MFATAHKIRSFAAMTQSEESQPIRGNPHFVHKPCAKVDPACLGNELTNFPPASPMMMNYNIPDFFINKTFEDRATAEDVQAFDQNVRVMEMLGGGHWFSQSSVDAVWNHAFTQQIIDAYKSAHNGRKPKSSFLCGR